MNKMLKTLFTAFDRTGNALVDLDELSSGFSLMTEGSKSDKLSLAFDVFDADDDGHCHVNWEIFARVSSVILDLVMQNLHGSILIFTMQ